MKNRSYLRFLASAIPIFGAFLSSPVLAHNVLITAGAPGTSTNGSFVGQVWTPTDDSTLVYADLLDQLGSSDAVISTNGPGDITVAASFDYGLAVSRQLTLSAEGNIDISGITVSGTGSLSVTANATGGVQIAAAGLGTNGGSFQSFGTDFSNLGPPLATGGGDVSINHTGDVLISAGGLATGGGSLTSSGANFLINGPVTTGGGNVVLNHSGTVSIVGPGLNTGNGTFTSSGTQFSVGDGGAQTGSVLLNHTGNVSISGAGVATNGGPFVSNQGADFECSANCLDSNGGNVIVDHSGNIAISDAGLRTDGGSFSSTGMAFNISGSGLTTAGGDVSLNQTGDINITNGGVTTEGGDFSIHRSANVGFSQGGLNTNGGSIFVETNGSIEIPLATTFRSGQTNSGGNIHLRAGNAITIGTVISTAPGSGGSLILQGNTAAIELTEAPDLGAGDIVLFVGTLARAIPTLSQWGMILLILVFLVSTHMAIRRKGALEKGANR